MIYYTYCPETFVLTGLVTADTPPPCSSKWRPPAEREGQQIYHNGVGWMHALPLDQLTPELLRAAQLDILKRELKAATGSLVADYPPEEVATWEMQYADAREYQRTGRPSPFLTALSIARGVDLDTLVPKILRKALAYHVAKAGALGTYQKRVEEVMKAVPTLTQELLQEKRLHIR